METIKENITKNTTSKKVEFPSTHWLKKLKKELLEVEPTVELILYGSRARGTAKEDSDWDLLILTENEKITLDIEKKYRMPVVLIEIEIGEVISLQLFNKKEWHTKYYISPYYKNIKKEGILI